MSIARLDGQSALFPITGGLAAISHCLQNRHRGGMIAVPEPGALVKR